METKVQRCKGRHNEATDAQQKTTGNKTVGPQTINSFKPSSLLQLWHSSKAASYGRGRPVATPFPVWVLCCLPSCHPPRSGQMFKGASSTCLMPHLDEFQNSQGDIQIHGSQFPTFCFPSTSQTKPKNTKASKHKQPGSHDP